MYKLLPVFKDNLWGGSKLKEEYGKVSDKEIIAESWELSAVKGSQSLIGNGPYEGKTISQYIELAGKEVLGSKVKDLDFFPLLIKFIDAKQDLSIQVHPDDEYALKNYNSKGKTEMWYILDNEEGACLYFGLNKDVSQEELANALNSGEIINYLNKVEVAKGDIFFIPAGTIHAIGAGIQIIEIQENSDITYRLYDYNRVGKDGKKRDLHIKEAIDVASLKKSEVKKNKVDKTQVRNTLIECPFFNTYEVNLDGETEIKNNPESFICVNVIEGKLTFAGKETMTLNKGDSLFVPASDGDIKVSGKGRWIETMM